ncbi:AAA family ATPase [Candidatus Oleimmundimicrobium sp.]|uniref:AAA family ATPase n=1 Tax=Candidatus Oleimmundimicrobium sp. TaxID=3060597 RepID=UPI002719DD74|nr:AAA family ATPase [Candidatus Oleimmundimicrobium sp.]MDO8886679.1 AAA family ATPase [Candidatus Oleimmundimicrobium sp.]
MGKIITIWGNKGGAGKSSIALALAEVASEQKNVCLVELDFSPGCFRTYFKITGDISIENAIDDVENVEKYLITPEGKKYKVLLGDFPDRAEEVKGEKLTALLNTLSKKFDLVLIDTQPSTNDTILDTIKASDEVFMVTEGAITTLGRGNGLLDYLELHKLADLEKFKMIVNKKEKKLPFDELGKIPIIKVIPKFRRHELGSLNGFRKHAEEILEECFDDMQPQKRGLLGRLKRK